MKRLSLTPASTSYFSCVQSLSHRWYEFECALHFNHRRYEKHDWLLSPFLTSYIRDVIRQRFFVMESLTSVLPSAPPPPPPKKKKKKRQKEKEKREDLVQWSTTFEDIRVAYAENSQLSKILSLQPEEGQDIGLNASPTRRNSDGFHLACEDFAKMIHQACENVFISFDIFITICRLSLTKSR